MEHRSVVDEEHPDRSADAVDEVTEVEIFGAVYHVRGRQDRDYLQQVAALVDRTMRDVAGRTRRADAGKIAILAALNIADELLQSRNTQEGERVEIRDRVTALTRELQDALGR
ncbi:MAG TPA: cell division protein ZapA [Thermoanaerobaculia bacterium]|nr:cell division protein ZapA [Thermoanaerobaculia bacterium]